jgi:hypothetical protein
MENTLENHARFNKMLRAISHDTYCKLLVKYKIPKQFLALSTECDLFDAMPESELTEKLSKLELDVLKCYAQIK